MGNIIVPKYICGNIKDFSILSLIDDKFAIVLPFPDRVEVLPLEDVNEERKGDDEEVGLCHKKTDSKSDAVSKTTAPTMTGRASPTERTKYGDDDDEE